MRRMSGADSVVRFCAVILPGLIFIFLLPAASVAVSQAKTMLLALVVLVGAVAWGYGRYRDRAAQLPAGLLPLAVVSLPVIYAISALMNGAPIASFAGGMGEQDTVAAMFLLSGCFLLCALAFEDVADAAVVYLRSLAIGGLALMLVQILHLFVPAVTLGVLTGPATSIFGSWHELGIISGLLLFTAIALWDTPAAENGWKWVFSALGIGSAFMLLVVDMSDVWYVLGALTMLFSLYQWYVNASVVSVRGKGGQTARVVATLIIGACALAAGYGGSFIYTHVPAPMRVLNPEVSPSWQSTFAVGQGAFTGVIPALFGSGPNTFSREWNLYRPVSVNDTGLWNVDFNAGAGFIPTAFVTVGLLGVLAWILLFLALIAAFADFMRERTRAPERAVVATLFGSTFYLVLFHILYAPGAGLSVLMFAFLGAFAASGSRGMSRTVSLRPYNRAGVVRVAAVMAVPVVLILSSGSTLRAEASDILVNASAVTYAKTGDMQQTLSLVGDALAVNPRNTRAERAAVELGLAELSDFSAQGATSTAELKQTLQSAIEHGLAAVSIDSGDYRNWLAIADLYQTLAGAGVQGAYDNAKTAYERAHIDNPANPLPLISLAQLDIAQKDYPDALTLLNEAVTLKSDLPAIYALRSQVEVALQKIPEAVTDATTVAQATPDDPQGWYNLGVILYGAGSYQEAANSLERAVALQRDYANALFVLGLAYDSLGRVSDALNAFLRVAQLAPSDMTVPRILQNLEAGRPALSTATSSVGSIKASRQTAVKGKKSL